MENIANILIVDDNPQNRNLLNRMVMALGHVPILAENGMDALVQLRSTVIDVVLLDILMPEMNGHEVLNRIKSDESLSDIPVIMISALDDIDTVVRCIGNGAIDYLTKPFNSTILKTRIGTCLEQKRLRDREKDILAEQIELHKELKINYEALQKSEQQRDAMCHMIVHDLRNPLTIILGTAQLIQVNNNQESTAKSIPLILKAGRNMEELINNVLDISKLESGEMPVVLSSLNITQIINDISEQFIITANKKGIQLLTEFKSDKLIAIADKELMLRILQNLVGNGLKNTESLVKISAKCIDNNVIISVTDNGPGIPRRYKDKIFDKYFQINADEETNNLGVGLGLAFCKMAVDAQKGSINVESKEGEGASFKVKLNVPAKIES